jgi:hypothetical protein
MNSESSCAAPGSRAPLGRPPSSSFDPALILIVTGAKALYPVPKARQIIAEGLARIAAAARRHGLTVGVEVLRDEMNGSLYNDLPRTFQLLDDVGADNSRSSSTSGTSGVRPA